MYSGKHVLVKILKKAINFAGMLLVASKQHMSLFETVKSYDSWLSGDDFEMKTHKM